MGVPLNHPFLDAVFPLQTNQLLGYPHFGKPPNSWFIKIHKWTMKWGAPILGKRQRVYDKPSMTQPHHTDEEASPWWASPERCGARVAGRGRRRDRVGGPKLFGPWRRWKCGWKESPKTSMKGKDGKSKMVLIGFNRFWIFFSKNPKRRTGERF